jgi:hypothetical protein
MKKIEGWRKFLGYVIALLVVTLPDTFKHPLGAGTINTIENISYAYLVGQSAIDIITARAKGQEKKETSK